MRTTLVSVIALVIFGGFAHAQTAMTLCELLRNPNKYAGQSVKVRGTFRYGFEWAQFYCLDCLDRGKAWLTMSSDMDDKSDKVGKKMPKFAGIVNLTVVGVFHFGTSYGHMNGYRYELIAQQIRDVAVIQKGMRPLAEEAKAERQWACGGVHPR
jgi:hypothetical protein